MPHISNKGGLFVQTPLPGEYPLHVIHGPIKPLPPELPKAGSGNPPGWACVHHDSEIVEDE